MQAKEKTKILTGGLILVTVGALILLNQHTEYGFGRTWPVFLIVISVGTLIQRYQDVGGWLIGIAGVVFLVMKNWFTAYEKFASYGLPVLLIALGIFFMFFKKSKRY
jgi:hypothetical protein